jgi:hypothetical protein
MVIGGGVIQNPTRQGSMNYGRISIEIDLAGDTISLVTKNSQSNRIAVEFIIRRFNNSDDRKHHGGNTDDKKQGPPDEDEGQGHAEECPKEIAEVEIEGFGRVHFDVVIIVFGHEVDNEG